MGWWPFGCWRDLTLTNAPSLQADVVARPKGVAVKRASMSSHARTASIGS